MREVFDPALRRLVTADFIPRSSLAIGDSMEGPAIIVEDETSIVVSSEFAAAKLPGGEIELVRKAPGA